jgi:small subunit ribosomal protein S9
MEQYVATGRRKEAVARVYLRPGTGAVSINKRTLDHYFPIEVQRTSVTEPLRITETLGRFDIFAKVHGGGPNGQAGALRLGIARALVLFNGEFRGALRKEEMLTRDPRMVERKKYGQKKARKRFQFSKR